MKDNLTQKPNSDMESILAEIQAADLAINEGSFNKIADFYTEDAALVVKPGLVVHGREAIEKAYLKIADYFNHSLRVSQENLVVIETGGLALVHAKTFIDASEKTDSEYSSKREAVYVYSKGTDGRWRCAIDNSYGAELLHLD